MKKETFLLILAVAFYVAGAFFWPKDGTDLFESRRSLTYVDVYVAQLFLFVPCVIICYFVFGEENRILPELESVTICGCMIGVILAYMTTRSEIASTILYWLGSISAIECARTERNKKCN